jgi:hypothetical protein
VRRLLGVVIVVPWTRRRRGQVAEGTSSLSLIRRLWMADRHRWKMRKAPVRRMVRGREWWQGRKMPEVRVVRRVSGSGQWVARPEWG